MVVHGWHGTEVLLLCVQPPVPPAHPTPARTFLRCSQLCFLHLIAPLSPSLSQPPSPPPPQIDILTRMYPCGECARHFRELVAASPPSVASRRDFSLWMCEAHNTVNRRLGKPTFNCALVEARWAGMGCEDEAGGQDACSLEVGRRW